MADNNHLSYPASPYELSLSIAIPLIFEEEIGDAGTIRGFYNEFRSLMVMFLAPVTCKTLLSLCRKDYYRELHRLTERRTR